jgi:hypothetical protein
MPGVFAPLLFVLWVKGQPTRKDNVKAGVPLTMTMMTMAAETTTMMTAGGASFMGGGMRLGNAVILRQCQQQGDVVVKF